MELVTILGLLAATLTTISFLPQALKTIKTKQTKDLSLLTYSMLLVGILAWLAYGIVIKDLPIILANAITSIFVIIIWIMKIKYH